MGLWCHFIYPKINSHAPFSSFLRITNFPGGFFSNFSVKLEIFVFGYDAHLLVRSCRKRWNKLGKTVDSFLLYSWVVWGIYTQHLGYLLYSRNIFECLEDKIQQEFKKLLRYLELFAAIIPLFLEFSNHLIALSFYLLFFNQLLLELSFE